MFLSGWDKTCKKCALCCYEKKLIDGTVIIDLESPCEYLDTETRLCTIYKRRFKINKRCKKINIFRVLFSSLLPSTCSYVEKYRPKYFNR